MSGVIGEGDKGEGNMGVRHDSFVCGQLCGLVLVTYVCFWPIWRVD